MSSVETLKRKSWSGLAKGTLFFGLLMNAIGHSYLIISFPNLAREMGFSDIQGGMVLGLGALGYLLAAPIWGFVSEQIGRRPVLIIGFLSASIAPFVFGILFSWRIENTLTMFATFVLVIITRLLQSLATGGLLPAAQAFMADHTSIEQRTKGMGILAASFGLGTILGAGLLWALSDYSVLLGFFLIAVFTGLACFFNWLFLVDAPQHKASIKGSSSKVPWTSIWPFLFITLFGVATYSLLNHVTGLHLQDQFNLSSQNASREAGKLLAFTALAMVFTQGVIIQLLNLPPHRLMQIGAIVAVSALCCLSQFVDYSIIVGSMACLGFALGLVLPANLSLLSLHSKLNTQGKVAGINAMGQGLGMAAGPIFGSVLFSQHYSYPYLATAGLLVMVLVLSFVPKIKTNN